MLSSDTAQGMEVERLIKDAKITGDEAERTKVCLPSRALVRPFQIMATGIVKAARRG
jgi:hypothetical protein